MDAATLRTMQSLSGTYAARLRNLGPDDPETFKAFSALKLAKAKIYLERLDPLLTEADRKALKTYVRGL